MLARMSPPRRAGARGQADCGGLECEHDPQHARPEKYSWLGADQVATELPSGVIDMGARSYVPQLGRFLQTDPIAGGSANAYAYTFGDPVNTSDPSGAYTASVQGFAIESADERSAAYLEYLAMKAAEEAAARAEAERAAWEAIDAVDSEAEKAELSAALGGGGAEGPLGGFAGWACEYAVETGQEGEGCGGGGGGASVGTVDIGGSHFITDPGVPAGALCEGSVDSKKYKKEHPKLCHEIESNPWEPLDAFCLTVGAFNPFTGHECAAYNVGRAATK
jgi:RHS repeat-associated protein